ncbi:DUF3108 domain-containing protein [Candidatus Reidiella endopervernicosa]|uniref:DUF3108 domain-containing protein n=1 Tax=Candidatus Reidiella endopervernicosa TaxID=2738883 RepID=A0A6N0HZ30_9GAMM|nr:DUF3108 domain-containing protein [Candidatus Reidiella endopervernicosa]QKQ27575.1 DUF3108 domain-containing protein [Candidatus Reidiella endopervernicosa]
MQLSRFLITLLLIITLGTASAEPQLIPYSADYILNKSGLAIAEGRFKLKQNSTGNYTYESRSTPVSVVSWFRSDEILEQTTWSVSDSHVTPSFYRYEHTGIDDEKMIHVSFDYDAERVTTRVNSAPWSMELEAGMQDKMSVQMALQLALMAGERGRFEYRVADGGTPKTFSFLYQGEEVIKTPLGKFHTLRVKRENDKRGTTMWFAPELNYIPVRVEQKKKGMNLLIKKLKGLPLPDSKSGS